jgi:tRNA threonylcarbamoyladenosine biosynthesis protein TsaB
MLGTDARILALETSGQIGSVAIGTPAGVVAVERLPVDMRHAGELMPAVQRLLQQHAWPADSITDVFLSIGPGSFTGLRIAVSIARTLAWSIKARIVAVPTMHALARNALLAEADPPPAHVATIIDAKRAQVFTACYRLEASGQWPDFGEPSRAVASGQPSHSPLDSPLAPRPSPLELIPACLAEPREFLMACPKPLAVLGEGIPRHREAIEAAGATILPESLWAGRAENVLAIGLELARAGLFTPARELVPLYIRRPEMEERWEARQREKGQEARDEGRG